MATKRLFALDILRGLACALVLVGHAPVHYPKVRGMGWEALSCVRRVGWTGVDLFFVLSGLLIAGLLIREIQSTGTIQLKQFWLRRGFKIWPSYFAAFGILVVVCGSHSWWDHNWGGVTYWRKTILPNTFFIQNYCDELYRWPHSWTLAIEEHFYIVLPLLLLFLIRWRRLNWLPAIACSIFVAVLGMRLLAAAQGAAWMDIKYPTHFHADALMFGVLLGYCRAYRPELTARLREWWPVAIIFALVTYGVSYLLLRDQVAWYAMRFSLVYLAMGGLVFMAACYPNFGMSGPVVCRAVAHFFAQIGVYSYTIYLAHGVVFGLWFIQPVLELLDHPLWAPTVFIVGSILAGIALSHAVERPCLALRDRWVPSRSRALPVIVAIPNVVNEKPLRRSA